MRLRKDGAREYNPCLKSETWGTRFRGVISDLGHPPGRVYDCCTKAPQDGVANVSRTQCSVDLAVDHSFCDSASTATDKSLPHTGQFIGDQSNCQRRTYQCKRREAVRRSDILPCGRVRLDARLRGSPISSRVCIRGHCGSQLAPRASGKALPRVQIQKV